MKRLLVLGLILSGCCGHQVKEYEVERSFCKDLGYDSKTKENAFLCSDPSEEVFNCEAADKNFICKVKR